MSVNNSRIIGPIQNDTEVLMIGRSNSNYFTYTDVGFASYGSNYDGKYYLFETNYQSDGLKLSARQACELFPRHCDASPKRSCKEDVFARSKECYKVFTVGDECPVQTIWSPCDPTGSINRFKLSQPCTKAPNDKLYAGIWYNLITGDNEDVLFDVYEPKSGSGFAGNIGKKTLAKIEVTFIPFSNEMSFYHSGDCFLKYKQTPFKFFEWWTKGKNLSKSCEKGLNSGSEFCVLTGTRCLDGYSYRYCSKDEDCGTCHGVCPNGGQCLSSGKGKFYCYLSPKSSSNSKTVTVSIILVFFLIVSVLMILFGLHKWRAK